MNILFVWTGVTSYMADCWRALAALPEVSLRIVIVESPTPPTAFNVQEVMNELDCKIVTDDAAAPFDWIGNWRPDVAFVVGWHSKICRAFVLSKLLAGVPKSCVFDMPWQWRFRKFAARFVLAPYLRHFDSAFVPGRAAARYAHWLGFKDVRTGLFGIDTKKFDVVRSAEPYFLYIGRNSAEKRIGDLRKAYALYARRVSAPWPLKLIGKGLEGGFVQPADLPELYAGAGALVLASDFDPWPLVIAESCAAGLPVICSDSCTNHFELVKENGIVVKTGDVAAFADAMERIHRLSETDRRGMGAKGRALVAPYDSHAWAVRVKKMCEEMMK